MDAFTKVTSFVHSIVKKVIPLAMFGTVENRAVILQGIYFLVYHLHFPGFHILNHIDTILSL